MAKTHMYPDLYRTDWMILLVVINPNIAAKIAAPKLGMYWKWFSTICQGNLQAYGHRVPQAGVPLSE